MHKQLNQHFDTLIIGSGLAGFTLALNLDPTKRICIVTKQTLSDSASGWAQGGIAAALSPEDSPEKHVQDTLIAGAGLCQESTVRFIADHAREAIHWLIDQGVEFTRDDRNGTGYHLTKEGGHSVRRIIHSGDATGNAVQRTLIEKYVMHRTFIFLSNISPLI